VLGDTFLGVAFYNLVDYIFFVTFMEVIMFTSSEKAMLISGLDLLAAQKSRFAKSQPEFGPIAADLEKQYSALRLKLGGLDEAPSSVKK